MTVPPPSTAKITVDDMVNVLAAEADRIRTTQVVLVKMMARTEADPTKIWEAEVLETAVRFFVLAKPFMPEIKQLIAARSKQR